MRLSEAGHVMGIECSQKQMLGGMENALTEQRRSAAKATDRVLPGKTGDIDILNDETKKIIQHSA